jgi:hypothetical protein
VVTVAVPCSQRIVCSPARNGRRAWPLNSIVSCHPVDTRSISAVLLKTAGLLTIAYCLAQLPGFFPLANRGGNWSFAMAVGAAAIGLGPLLILGGVLWFFPGKVANRIVSGPVNLVEPADTRRLELIALALLGLLLLVTAFVDVVLNVVYLIAFQRENPDASFIPAAVLARFAAALLQIGIGGAFCIGARGVWRLIERLRG